MLNMLEYARIFAYRTDMNLIGRTDGRDGRTDAQTTLPGGDVEHAWIMFDHVKRVKNWTTMAYHVYNSAYCRVMTIAVCDMQSEDAAAQMVLWKNLNDVMARHGFQSRSSRGSWRIVLKQTGMLSG
jgi:hypothetical protein